MFFPKKRVTYILIFPLNLILYIQKKMPNDMLIACVLFSYMALWAKVFQEAASFSSINTYLNSIPQFYF